MGEDGSFVVAEGVMLPSVCGEGEEGREGESAMRLANDIIVDRLRGMAVLSDSLLLGSEEGLRFGARVEFKGVASCDGSK